MAFGVVPIVISIFIQASQVIVAWMVSRGLDIGPLVSQINQRVASAITGNDLFVSGIALVVGFSLWLWAKLNRRALPSDALYLFLFGVWSL